MSPSPTAADLRALVAFHRVRIYRLAGLIGLHPSRLSTYLQGHVPIPPALAERITRAVGELAGQQERDA